LIVNDNAKLQGCKGAWVTLRVALNIDLGKIWAKKDAIFGRVFNNCECETAELGFLHIFRDFLRN
jgi:hypothetical protein